MDGVIGNSSATVWRCKTDIFETGIFPLLITSVFLGFPCMNFPRVLSCRLYPSLYGIAAYPKIFRGIYRFFLMALFLLFEKQMDGQFLSL